MNQSHLDNKLKHIWLYLTSESYRLKSYIKDLNRRYKQMTKNRSIFRKRKL